MAGQMYRWLVEAVGSAGSHRSVYSHDTTLARRGLLTRADRRARELRSAGVGSGDVVVVALGNVVEFLVLLLASSQLDAVAVVTDAADGDRTFESITERMRVRACVRRPRGHGDPAPAYKVPLRNSRRLSGSLACLDVLENGVDSPSVALPPDAELVLESQGIGGAPRYIVHNAAAIRQAGKAARSLGLEGATRIVCAQPLTMPSFFCPVVLGWLASEAQLVLGEGPSLDRILSLVGAAERVVLVDTLRQALQVGRLRQSTRFQAPVAAVVPQATVPAAAGSVLEQRLDARPLQLLSLDELGILALRPLARNACFESLDGVELRSGAEMLSGGQEILARMHAPPTTVPAPAPDDPGTPGDTGGWLHTGYGGRFNKHGLVREVVGRDDGLVELEGRRACLNRVEDAMALHPRLTWVRAFLEHDADGAPELHLEYRATGSTDLDDLQDFAVGVLSPFMVPRVMQRVP